MKYKQAMAAVSNATKATTLVVLGSERAVFAAGFAALLVAVGAGVGEEVLFRGVLQEGLSQATGSRTAGLVCAAAIFGALHFATPLYALLASGAGLYFGWLYYACGCSVVAPAVAHVLYDWVALVLVHLDITGDPSKKGGAAGSAKSIRARQLEILRGRVQKPS
jgi:membrane protease YdiL (CAAX protease family)